MKRCFLKVIVLFSMIFSLVAVAPANQEPLIKQQAASAYDKIIGQLTASLKNLIRKKDNGGAHLGRNFNNNGEKNEISNTFIWDSSSRRLFSAQSVYRKEHRRCHGCLEKQVPDALKQSASDISKSSGISEI